LTSASGEEQAQRSGHKRQTSVTSWADMDSSSEDEQDKTAVVAIVDKNAFNEDVEVPFADMKRFKRGGACTKWLGKCISRDKTQAVVLLVKTHELEVVREFLSGAAAPQVHVLPYGAGFSCSNLSEAIEAARSHLAVRRVKVDARLDHVEAPTPTMKEYRRLEEVPRLMWVDDSVGSWKIGATGSQGFATAAKAIAWMDRHMKLWHTACAQCTVKRRCATCNAAYTKSRAAARNPWVGEKLTGLVAAHHVVTLRAYLARFPEGQGPFADLHVYGPAGSDQPSFAEAVRALHVPLCQPVCVESVGALSPDFPLSAESTPPRSRTSSVSSEELGFEGAEGLVTTEEADHLNAARCLTPVPEDSEFPWLFYDQIRAATDDTLRMAGNFELAQTLGAVDAQAIIGPIAKSMDKMSQSITQHMDQTGKMMLQSSQSMPLLLPELPASPPSPTLSASFGGRKQLSPRQLGASYLGMPLQQQGSFSGPGSFAHGSPSNFSTPSGTPLPGSFVGPAPTSGNLGNVNFMQQQMGGSMGFVPAQSSSIHGTGNSGFIPNVGVLMPSQPARGPVVGYALVPVVGHPYGGM
jgi:hypothetical protein